MRPATSATSIVNASFLATKLVTEFFVDWHDWMRNTTNKSRALIICFSQANCVRSRAHVFAGVLAKIVSGGEGGIRTPDTVARMPHFECGGFNHSPTSPDRSPQAINAGHGSGEVRAAVTLTLLAGQWP